MQKKRTSRLPFPRVLIAQEGCLVMIIDLVPVFDNDGCSVNFDYNFDAEDGFLSGVRDVSPIRVHGALRNELGTVSLEAEAAYSYSSQCDRCAEDFTRTVRLPVMHYLAASLNDEENDEFILVRDMRLDLDELVREDILLNFPIQVLCKEDCNGLCMICGADLNEGVCLCKKPVDPRLSALADLLDSD